MQSVEIRKITAADLDAVYELVRDLAIFEKEEEQFTIGMEEYRQQFAEGLFQVLVAELNKEVLGMALFYPSFSTWKGKMMYLEDFVVKESSRNMGVGQALFDAFLGEAKAQNCKMVKWQVLDWNETAINFYKKNKATIEGQWLTGKIIF